MSLRFSVITPCYRGAAYLPRLHESLMALEGGHEVEWIIVDDYSNDGGRTREAIEQLARDTRIPTRALYLATNHYGSQSTYRGAQAASGDYALILDQDDMLTPDALNVFADGIRRYGSHDDFAGVCGRCQTLDGNLIGTRSPWHEKYSDELHIRHGERIRGEMFQCSRTSLLIEYFRGMKPGYTNGWAWSRIARKYQYLYTDRVVRVYDTGNPQSVSNLKKLIYLDAQFEQMTEYLSVAADPLRRDRAVCLRMMIQWTRIGLHAGNRLQDVIRLAPPALRPLALVAAPLGALRAAHDIRHGRIGRE